MHPPFEAYSGDKPYLFVSYSHKDSDAVFAELAQWHARGYRIWYDEGIDPGNEWPEEIARALESCVLFVVFITHNAITSRNVRNEIGFALEQNKNFLAIHLTETALPPGMKLQMGSIQAVMKYRMSLDMYDRKIEKIFDGNGTKFSRHNAGDVSYDPEPNPGILPVSLPEKTTTPDSPGTTDSAIITDIDGNEYHTVKIGNQIWTVENLSTLKFNDGSLIPLITDSAAWAKMNSPGCCFYENDIGNKLKYGVLYNWYAVNTRKLAPAGWHIPSDAEWTTLENYLIANGYNWDGTTTGNKIAKSMAGNRGWSAGISEGAIGKDLTKNNRSGFSALGGGYRTLAGTFNHRSLFGRWGSATESDASRAWLRTLGLNSEYLYRSGITKGFGFSVRLLRD